MKTSIEITDEVFHDVINFVSGLYIPLEGFMTSLDYHHVVDSMALGDHSTWTIPITLDVNHDTYLKAVDADVIYFTYNRVEIGYMEISDCFKVDAQKDALKIFGVDDLNHPGVKKELERSCFRVGGKVVVTDTSILDGCLSPENNRRIFANKGWKTIVGFQTRNPVHRAHEHLQRVGLDVCDGLFINPLVGWRKKGDFTEEAVMCSYKRMLDNYYPSGRVHLDGLRIHMRYAGPREAIFHATIRRNLGCTHFIIGRDHAGVGAYYGTYEAHELARKIQGKSDLGIELLLMKEPYYCNKCGQIVSEKHCNHSGDDIVKISGTIIREMLKNGQRPDERFMRDDISDALITLDGNLFIK